MPPRANFNKTSTVFRRALLLVLLLAWALLVFRLNEVPPGFQHDQMFNARDALGILRGHYRLYFPANFGREPLYMYSAAGILGLLGQTHIVWGLRFTTVIWAMLGLAVTMSCARRYLSRWAVPVAGAAMAGSFWFLFAGRLGLEPMPLVALAMGMIYFMDRGLARKDPAAMRADLAVAGLLGGLATYTYLAGRVLVVLALLMPLYQLLARAWQKYYRRQIPAPDPATGGLALSALILFAVSAPLLIYVSSHASEADRRVGEVGKSLYAALQGDPTGLLANVRETVLAIVVAGSRSLPYQYNVPGRPVLLPAWAILFGIGVVVSLARVFLVREREGVPAWPARRHELLFLTALVLGLAPDLITGADALYMRGIIALPLIFIFSASGLWSIAKLLAPRWPARFSYLARPAFAALIALLLALQFATNGHAYFQTWAGANKVQRIYNGDLRAAAAHLDGHFQGEQVVFGTDRLSDLDSMTYELYEPRHRDIRWFQLPSSPPLPANDHAVYIVTGSATELTPSLAYLLATARDRQALPDASGMYTAVQTFRLYRSDIDKALADSGVRGVEPAPVFGDALRLTAAGLTKHDEGVDFISRWSVLGAWPRPQQPPKISVSVLDTTGYRWTQFDSPTDLPFETWQSGESYVEVTHIPLPSDLLPGDYTVRMAMYTDNAPSLPVVRAGAAAGDAPIVATGRIVPGETSTAAPAPPLPLDALSEAAVLQPLGKWEPVDTLVTGLPDDMHVSWAARENLETAGLHFRLDAESPDGRVLWTQDASPAFALPTTWQAGQTYRLTHVIRPPDHFQNAVKATLRLCVEWKGQDAGCTIVAEPRLIDHLPLMALSTPPQHLSGADWGGQLILAGYDLVQHSKAISLTLYWQAKSPPSATLKRFVHGVDANGKIVTQVDGVPDNAGIPMPYWQAGEYVVDRVVLPVQAGQPLQNLMVGLYNPETGKRVAVRMPSGAAVPDDRLPLAAEGTGK